MGDRPTSIAKRHAVMAAAERAFLGSGYDAVTMDDIAEASGVAKQTIYSHFGNKESLFLHMVTSMTTAAGDQVHSTAPEIPSAEDIGPVLEDVMLRQLDLVLAPRLLHLRRLVIGEARRFPALAQELSRNGPQRAIGSLTGVLADLDARGLMLVPEPRTSATQLNWLVMGDPVNTAMLMGDDAVMPQADRSAHVHTAVATFLRAYSGSRA